VEDELLGLQQTIMINYIPASSADTELTNADNVPDKGNPLLTINYANELYVPKTVVASSGTNLPTSSNLLATVNYVNG
jgi:hypothetical protein